MDGWGPMSWEQCSTRVVSPEVVFQGLTGWGDVGREDRVPPGVSVEQSFKESTRLVCHLCWGGEALVKTEWRETCCSWQCVAEWEWLQEWAARVSVHTALSSAVTLPLWSPAAVGSWLTLSQQPWQSQQKSWAPGGGPSCGPVYNGWLCPSVAGSQKVKTLRSKRRQCCSG